MVTQSWRDLTKILTTFSIKLSWRLHVKRKHFICWITRCGNGKLSNMFGAKIDKFTIDWPSARVIQVKRVAMRCRVQLDQREILLSPPPPLFIVLNRWVNFWMKVGRYLSKKRYYTRNITPVYCQLFQVGLLLYKMTCYENWLLFVVVLVTREWRNWSMSVVL